MKSTCRLNHTLEGYHNNTELIMAYKLPSDTQGTPIDLTVGAHNEKRIEGEEHDTTTHLIKITHASCVIKFSPYELCTDSYSIFHDLWGL